MSCLPCGEQLVALFRFCQSLCSAPLSPERATPLYGGRQAALFTFPRRSKTAEGRPSFPNRFRTSPRTLQMGNPSCRARLYSVHNAFLTARNQYYSARRTARWVYINVNKIVGMEMYRLSGLCSCSVLPRPMGVRVWLVQGADWIERLPVKL